VALFNWLVANGNQTSVAQQGENCLWQFAREPTLANLFAKML